MPNLLNVWNLYEPFVTVKRFKKSKHRTETSENNVLFSQWGNIKLWYCHSKYYVIQNVELIQIILLNVSFSYCKFLVFIITWNDICYRYRLGTCTKEFSWFIKTTVNSKRVIIDKRLVNIGHNRIFAPPIIINFTRGFVQHVSNELIHKFAVSCWCLLGSSYQTLLD